MSIVNKIINFSGQRINYRLHTACTHCEGVDGSPYDHLCNLVADASSISIGEMHCLARSTLTAGDKQSAECLAKLFLDIGPQTERKRKAEEPAEEESDTKKRETEARRVAAQLLAKRVLVATDLGIAKDEIPQAEPNKALPKIGDFLKALEVYVRIAAHINPEAKIELHGAGIYLRAKGTTTDASGGHVCSVFLPKPRLSGENLSFKVHKALVDADGNIIRLIEGAEMREREWREFYPEDMTAENVFRVIANEVKLTASLSGIGVSFKLVPASTSEPLTPAIAEPFSSIDFQRISLTRFIFVTHFADSHENSATSSQKLIEFLNSLFIDRANLGRGPAARQQFRKMLAEALAEFPVTKFSVTVTGGTHSARVYTTKPNAEILGDLFQIELKDHIGLVPFEQFFTDVFPSQLFTEKEFVLVPAVDVENDVADFANPNYGRHMKISLTNAEVQFENAEFTLPALIIGAPEEESPAMGLDLASVTFTNDAPEFDKLTAATSFASSGSAQLADGRIVEYGNWQTLENAKAVVARDDQVTGFADDDDDIQTNASAEARLGVLVARRIKSARKLLGNLDALARTESLKVAEFAKVVVEMFEETDQVKQFLSVVLQFTDTGTESDVDYPGTKITIDSATYVAFSRKSFVQNVQSEEIRAFLYNNMTARFRRRKPTDPLVSATVLVKAGDSTAIRKFTGHHFVDLPTFMSAYADVPNSRLYIGRANGLHFLSTQFPFDSREKRIYTQHSVPSEADNYALFVLNGIQYGSIREFEEASRFEGFPELQRDFFEQSNKVEVDKAENTLRDKVKASEEKVRAAGASLTRQKFHDLELKHAMAQRVFQNPWLYQKLRNLLVEQPDAEFYLMPRIVSRSTALIGGVDEYSVEETMCVSSQSDGMFHTAMKFVKLMMKRDAQIYATALDQTQRDGRLSRAMLLPCPLVRNFIDARGTRESLATNASIHAHFVADVGDSYASHVLFSTGFLPFPDEARDLCVKNPLTHLSANVAQLVAQQTAAYPCDNTINDYRLLFGVMRSISRFPDLPSMYSATPAAVLDNYPEIGSVANNRGVPSFVVEVEIRTEKPPMSRTIFRSALTLFFEPGEPAAKTIVLKNDPEFLKLFKNYNFPKEMVFFVSRDAVGGQIYLESYRFSLPMTMRQFLANMQTPREILTLSQKVEEQSITLQRPQSATQEKEQDDVSHLLLEYDREIALLEGELNSSSVTTVDRPLLQSEQGETEPGAKKQRVTATPEEQLQTYVDEGNAALAVEWGAPPPSVAPVPTAAKKSRKPQTTVKGRGSAPRLVVKQTGASLISAPRIVEISNHGYRQTNVRVGYVERSDEDLDQTLQAAFLNPTYPKLPDTDTFEGFNREKFLNSVAKKFTSLMPRRSLALSRLLSEEKRAFLDKVDEATSAIREPVVAKIAAMKAAFFQKKNEGGLTKSALTVMYKNYTTEAEKMLAHVHLAVEKKRQQMLADYNATLKHKQKEKKKRKKASDDDDGSGDDDEPEDEADKALAYFLDKEADFENAPEYADSDFFVGGVHFLTLFEYFFAEAAKGPITPAIFNAASAAVRQRVMQNRALYDALLALKTHVIKTSNQIVFNTLHFAGKGLITGFADDDVFKVIFDVLTTPNTRTQITQNATRVRFGGPLSLENLITSVALVGREKVLAFIGDRATFFARTPTLMRVNQLLAPIRIVVSESDQSTQEIDEIAVAAARELFDSEFANMDFCVLESTDEAHTVGGFLIGGFIDKAVEKTHVFEIAGMEALTELAAARLLDYAEHTVKYSDPTEGVGRKESVAVGVNVIGAGFRAGSNTPSALAIERVLEVRGYKRVAAGANDVVWTLNADEIDDRVHFLANDFFGSLHTEWLENDLVTDEQWHIGNGRFFMLTVDGREVTRVDDAGDVVPVYVWREAPHPMFTPEKIENELQQQLSALGTLEPMSYLVVKCYAVGKDTANQPHRKLLYETPAAPDWIKMNDEVAFLPFENYFHKFTRTDPSVYEQKKNVDNEIVNSREQTLKDQLTNILTVIENRRKKGAAREAHETEDARLVGASEEERDIVARLETELGEHRSNIARANNTVNRLEEAVVVVYDDYHFVDWAPNSHLLGTARVEFSEPRYSATIEVADGQQNVLSGMGYLVKLLERLPDDQVKLLVSVPPHTTQPQHTTEQNVVIPERELILAQLAEDWANIKKWKPRSLFDPEIPPNRAYKPMVATLAKQTQEAGWREASLTRAELNRWRAFYNKYTPPQPYTSLEAMLILARDSANEVVFEVEEHAYIANEVAPPVVVFRSAPLAVAAFFDQTAAYSNRLRIRRRADGELDPMIAGQMVNNTETLEDYEGDPDVFIRSLNLTNTLVRDEVFATPSALLNPVKQQVVDNVEQTIDLVAFVKTSNFVTNLTIEFNNNLEVVDEQPERVALGAFFITSESNEDAAPSIEISDKPLEDIQSQSRMARAEAVNSEHFGAASHGTESEEEEEDEDFQPDVEDVEEEEEESGSEDDNEGSMPVDEMLRMFAKMK